MWYCYHIWSKEGLMQTENDDDLDGGERSSEVKWGKLCAMATIFCQKKCWCKLRMIMTFMEVKGHQSSNVGKLCDYGYHIGSKDLLMQAKNDNDLHGGQKSSEVKYNMCHGYHIWAKELLMQVKNDDDDLHGGQRSSEVKWGKLCFQSWCKFRMTDLHGGQRPTKVKYSE